MEELELGALPPLEQSWAEPEQLGAEPLEPGSLAPMQGLEMVGEVQLMKLSAWASGQMDWKSWRLDEQCLGDAGKRRIYGIH